jgi:transposase InsO family protein
LEVKDTMTKDEKFQKIALFRYSLIAPAVANTFEAPSLAQYFRNIAAMKHRHPDGRLVKVTSCSLQRWYYAYKKLGLNGITPKIREDIGKPRALSNEAVDRIHELREQFPYITGKAIHLKLVECGAVNAADVSLATIHRYLKNNGLKAAGENAREVRAFEMEFANDCWQTDASVGPVIKIGGKKTRTHLFAFVDDASRHILHAQFYENENTVNMQDAFRQAIAKAGVPKMLFCDNGAAFSNHQLQLICASLGIALVHSRPYAARSRGKIERVFKTVKDGWMNATDWSLFSSLEDIDDSLGAWLSEKYTNSVHSAIKCTPKQRFMRDYGKIRHMPAEELALHFLHRKECRVANDSTVKLLRNVYEVPQHFIGSKIKVRYLPSDTSKLFIFSDGGALLHTVYPVKKVDNSKIKRAAIDYTLPGGAS